MKYSESAYDVGVIVGRFQIHDLHGGHTELLNFVCGRHRKVILALGCSPLANSRNNPLDFESRRQLIQASYPHIVILPLMDMGSDMMWSLELDRIVGDVLSPTQNALLYGGRDSFIRAYHGRFPTYEIKATDVASASKIRDELRLAPIDSPDFRAGVIWASQNRYPTNYATVDVAIFSPNYDKILLGKKKHEPLWRLIGGFADPRSPTYEDDAIREAQEEASVTVDYIQYLMSATIDDWRYASEIDKIKSLLFIGTTRDEGEPGDDIAHLRWTWRHELQDLKEWIQPNHIDFVRVALDYANAKAVWGCQ